MGRQRTKNACCLTGMKVLVFFVIQMMMYDLFLLFWYEKVVFIGPEAIFVCGIVKVLCSAQGGERSVGPDGRKWSQVKSTRT